ncbi:hypothetical protein NA57DRAFT_52681 [Rhizodiscina lignyota]|uniref:USP domain-containing protein n=1 Tax=Rhizodiscina lignyota TaxID=1504668 RepID=A0A9P4M9Y3_9PEZI|nr:hypothetical protein NA57DRAFT_52681 [Rhizodiscina lignyota]
MPSRQLKEPSNKRKLASENTDKVSGQQSARQTDKKSKAPSPASKEDKPKRKRDIDDIDQDTDKRIARHTTKKSKIYAASAQVSSKESTPKSTRRTRPAKQPKPYVPRTTLPPFTPEAYASIAASKAWVQALKNKIPASALKSAGKYSRANTTPAPPTLSNEKKRKVDDMSADKHTTGPPVKKHKSQAGGGEVSSGRTTPDQKAGDVRKRTQGPADGSSPPNGSPASTHTSTGSDHLLSDQVRSKLLKPESDENAVSTAADQKPVKPLQNAGGASYINSAIQALAATLNVKELSQAVDMDMPLRFEGISEEDLLTTQGRRLYAQKYVRAHQSEQCPAAEAVALLAKLASSSSKEELVSSFPLQHSYEDAERDKADHRSPEKFLEYLLENIHYRQTTKDELLELTGLVEEKKTGDPGYLMSELKYRLYPRCICSDCGADNQQQGGVETGWILKINAPNSGNATDLTKSVDNYMREKTSVTDSKNCKKCNKKNEKKGERRNKDSKSPDFNFYPSFGVLPNNLILSLKHEKVVTGATFLSKPLDLGMWSPTEADNALYEVKAAVLCSEDDGHHVCYAKKGESWWECDDALLQKIKEDDLRRIRGRDCLLFLQRKDA